MRIKSSVWPYAVGIVLTIVIFAGLYLISSKSDGGFWAGAWDQSVASFNVLSGVVSGGKVNVYMPRGNEQAYSIGYLLGPAVLAVLTILFGAGMVILGSYIVNRRQLRKRRRNR